MNTGRQGINNLINGTSRCSSLCVCKMMRQGHIWIIKHFTLFWAVDNMSSVQSFYNPSSICVNQREKLISQRYCCFPRQEISFHKI